MRWNTHAWQSFLDTWLMGAGIGSVRASNWLLACPASIGLIGTSLFLGFLYTLARLPSISQTPKRDAVIRALKAGCLVGGVVVEHEMHVARLEDSAVDAAQKAQELPGPPLSWFAGKPLPGSGWRGRHSPMTMPDFTSSAANSVVVPWRL